MGYGEGPLLEQTIRLGRLERIYRAELVSPPYTVSNYPPLYPLVLSPFGRVWGPAFWYGRVLSALGVVAASVLVGLVLLSFPPVSYWASLYRVDALALALSLGGIWVAVRWTGARLAVPAAALLLVAAIFTRQS